MRWACLVCALALASPASGEGWYFEASLEGGAEFWTFTNATGDVSPRRVKGDEIWVTRTDGDHPFDDRGTCDFNNCTVRVFLNGKPPTSGAKVQVTFSNGVGLALTGTSDDALISNFTTYGMGGTNHFVHNLRQADWVDVSFDGMRHRFDLAGAPAALDAITPYLTGVGR